MKISQESIIKFIIEIEDIYTKLFFPKFKSAKDRLQILKRNLNA